MAENGDPYFGLVVELQQRLLTQGETLVTMQPVLSNVPRKPTCQTSFSPSAFKLQGATREAETKTGSSVRSH